MAEKPIENFNVAMKFGLLLLILWATITSIPEMLYNALRRFFPPKQKDLNGKHVLITGTGMGLGREMAIQIARQKARVICVDINEKANEDTCNEINQFADADRKAKAYTCDVGNVQAIEELKDLVLKEFGHVDILINNAGLIYGKPILEEEEKMVQKVISVNQMSSYWMTRSFLPHMKERKEGHLVYINSIASLTVLGDATIYTMTKFALLGLSLSLADFFSRETKFSNIKISSVHPYFISTTGLKAEARANNIKALKVESAARQIVTGIRREYFQFIVPGYELGYWLLCLTRVLPLPIYRKLANILNELIVKKEKSHKN